MQATTNLVAGLRHLRSNEQRMLWVDALCVNQSDLDERTLQVAKIWNIFSSAVQVVVWAGLEEEHSYRALDSMRQETPIRSDQDIPFGACNSFFARPYWRRVWVIQEIAAAEKLRAQCGIRTMPWSSIRRRLHNSNLIDFASFRWNIQKGRRGSLLGALYDTRISLASGPRDKVYALLGLTSDGTDIVPLTNYKIPVDTMLQDMTNLCS